MNSKDIYDAIGALDDDILEQSEFSKRRTGWLKRGAMAACLCLATGAFFMARGSQVEVKKIGIWRKW